MLVSMLALGSSGLCVGCAASPYQVQTARRAPLGDASLSVQWSARKSVMRAVSPRARYAEKLQPKLHNLLLERGFTLRKDTADLHLHVQIHEITTGAAGRESSCELHVEMFEEWPSPVSKYGSFPKKELTPVFSMMVSATEHKKVNGYPREMIAERAAERCVEELVAYLVRSRATPMV